MNAIVLLLVLGGTSDDLATARERLHNALSPEDRRAAYAEVLYQKDKAEQEKLAELRRQPKKPPHRPNTLDWDAVHIAQVAYAITWFNRRNAYLERYALRRMPRVAYAAPGRSYKR